MNHDQAAALSGIDRTTYTKAENGYPIRVRTAQKIASALGFDWTLFYTHECDDKEQSFDSA